MQTGLKVGSRFAVGVIACALCVLLMSSPSWAAAQAFYGKLTGGTGNVKLSDMKVHLGVELIEEYNDNIYNASEDEEEDLISTLTPGVMFTLGEDYRLTGGYVADMIAYSDNSDENFVAQYARVGTTLKFPSGFTVDASSSYFKTEDPRSEARQLRASHWTDDVDASVTYMFPGEKFSIRLGYIMNYLKYDQEANRILNKTKDSGTVAIFYKFLPKSSFLVEYSYMSTDFFDSADESYDGDYQKYGVMVGFKWDATAKMSGTLKTGYRTMNYDNEANASGTEYNDKDLWALSALLSYKYSDTTTVDIMLNRSLDDTTYSGATGEYSSSLYYINTGGSLGVTRQVDEKITVGGSFGYMSHEYNAIDDSLEAREDDVVEAELRATYAFKKWLEGGIMYQYNTYSSNDDGKDEKHNKIFVRLTAVL